MHIQDLTADRTLDHCETWHLCVSKSVCVYSVEGVWDRK